MEDSDLILIEKYQTNTLTQEELEAFEERRSNDKTFDQRVRLLQDINRSQNINTPDFKSLISDIAKDHKAPKQSKSKHSFIKLGLSLFIVLATITAYYFLNSQAAEQSSQKVFASYFEPYPNTITIRGSAQNEALLAQGMSAYDAKQYAAAYKVFEQIENNASEEAIRFYKAICLIAMNQPKSATTLLDTIGKLENGNYIDQAYWYRALAALQQNDPITAKEKLNAIIKRNQSKVYLKKAQELLDELK